MSDYSSSSSQSNQENRFKTTEYEPFHYDYYLSNSLDILDQWKASAISIAHLTQPEERTFAYLAKEFLAVSKIQKFRTADMIRCKAFIYMLRRAFEELSQHFNKVFDSKAYLANKEESVRVRVKESVGLELKLKTLLSYLQVVINHELSFYYNNQNREASKSFEECVFDITSKIYTYVCNPKLLWDTFQIELSLDVSSSTHVVSLGGNQAYYKNIMRSMLKRNWQLKEVYDRLLPDLLNETIQNYGKSDFMIRVISETMSLESAERLTEKQKRQFIDCMKGLYFSMIKLREMDLYYECLLTNFHLDILTSHRMFKDYEELENMSINVLKRSKNDASLMEVVYILQMNALPFEKRKRVPEIETQLIELTFNYIAVAKDILGQNKAFQEVVPIPLEKGYASSRYILEHTNVNALVGLLMNIQEKSKDAFSIGDISVHKVYLKISEILKNIYLSYQHQNWLFPTDILQCIPLEYFIQNSDEIRADVKKTLFMMVEAINAGNMPHKISYVEGNIVREKVKPSEYLQVIIYFLQECKAEQQYINLPQIVPVNIQTSILFIKSLELKLNNKEPTPDQMPYVVNMLKNCEKYKLTINFKWYQTTESIQDREIQFNIEKGLTEDWMREIYRGSINMRQSRRIRSHFEKYTNNKGLTILNLASIFKYCHQIEPGNKIAQKSIKEEDLFTLLEEIKMLMSIHFDIFNLNLDEEISLNYIHVCLGFYNSCYKETPENQAYILIMEKIMKPYLSQTNSSLSTFKNKYPGFFQRWLYSFQIGSIFSELGIYISQKGEDQSCRQDIINKIKMVTQFIDNRENILKNIKKLSDLTEFIVLFATLISRQSHPQVYVESVQLFCLFLNTFPEVQKEASIDFMLDANLLSDVNLIKEMLSYIQKSSKPYKETEVSMLNSLLNNLVLFMNKVGFKTVNDILRVYISKHDKGFNETWDHLLTKLFQLEQQNCTLLVNVFRLIILLKKMSHQTKQLENLDCISKLKIAVKSFHKLGKNVQLKEENFKFLELIFIEEAVNQLNKTEGEQNKEFNLIAREVFHDLIKNYGTNDDLIFFAEKLDFFDLVLGDNKSQLNPREESLLIDLMIQSRSKGNATELIKKIVRENSKICEISDKVIQILTKEKDKIHSHHINKFIHLNNRYPKQKIEQFIIDNIGCQRNTAAVKIKQQYLIKDLVRKLDKIPNNICEELLFKPIKNEEYQKLIDFVSDIFEKLLYLPIKKFEHVNLKSIELIHEENEDWNTESEGENQQQTKEEKKPKDAKSQKAEYKSNGSGESESDFVQDEGPVQMPNQQQSSQDYNSDQDDDYNRPDFLEIFTDEDKRKDLDLYSKFMVRREELDVLIDSQYQQLKPGSKFLEDKEIIDKILYLSGMLNQMRQQMARQIVAKMPQQLYQALKIYGLQTEIQQEMKAKKQKIEKIVTKPPKFMGQLFSERSESDDQNIIEDSSSNDEEDIDDEDIEDSDIDLQRDDSEQISESDSRLHNHRKKKKRSKARKSADVKFAEEQQEELPELVPTYSKIQEQINGTQLKREDLVKILQISIYWLLHLPQSQVRSKQITSYYMQILSSNLGQLFFESFMTILRFDQNQENLERFVAKLSGSKHQKTQIGLQQITIENAITNILYFIKEYQDHNKDNQSNSNILFKESDTLLPIAEQMITNLDLPIQNNCITILMIYIETNRGRIRNSISELDFTELSDLAPGYRLKYSQMVRIIEKICKYGSNNKIWEMIEENMNLKVKRISKLFSCIKGYGQYLYKKLEDVGFKIVQTIKSADNQLQKHRQHQKPHNIEKTHHIISKLVHSCKQQIKQFYYVNKFNLKKLMEDDNIDIYEEIQSVQTVPNKLLKNKDKIFKNKELIKLVEIMVYFIKMLKDQFYGKIEDKLFSKLIQYPRMIIEAVWYYIFIFAKHKEYKWTTPSEIEVFLKQYPYIGSYNFSNLQEVFNLVVYFLNLQPFCTDKFKQFFLPILMKHPKLAREIPLMFKVPKSGDDEDYNTQSIVVTRKCSFDMAFYQLTGQAIQVEFHGEEGSDHGGLVRELMIGWKGRGVGQEAFFIGKILGISFKQGVPYGGTLDIGMFVAITNYIVTIDFFQETDPQIYKSLVYIRENDPEPLCLKFVVEHVINGKLVQFELVQGGKYIDLVEANKHKYLQAYVKKYYYLGRQKELKQLKHGFNTVVYPEYAQIFTPLEMLKQIRGEEVVDVKMLISKARYEGYSADSAVIKWFWSIVETFDQEKMNTFIQFVTGSPKITVYNSNFSITIQKVYDIECLPVAHTCFNTIDLPEYSTKQILEKKLLTAILEGNYSFGIL